MSEMEVSDIPVEPVALVEDVPVAPEAVPVVQQAPSNTPEAEVVEVPAAVSVPVPLEDAVRVLLILVQDHRRPGDADVDAAIDDVKAALAA